jgi:glutathione-regulated potassium-efflux system ancillary protein KefC
VAGLIASLCRLPPLAGYLAADYALAYVEVPSSELISRLADLRIELLLFTVGLKLQLASLIRREVLGVSGLHMLIVTVGTGLGFLLLDKHITGGLLLGASLAFASTVPAIFLCGLVEGARCRHPRHPGAAAHHAGSGLT